MNLEPDGEAVVALDAPAVGEALEQHEPVASGGARGGWPGRLGLEPAARVGQPDPDAVGPDVGLHGQLVGLVAARVAHAVRRELGYEQLDVGEAAARQRVAELLAHGAAS